MDIFELAMAKKLFGGGGGKREGTAVPAGTVVEKIYFNTGNTKEETEALLSQLTFVETPFAADPIYPVYAQTADGDSGRFLFVVKITGGYAIAFSESLSADETCFVFYSYYEESANGWVYMPQGVPTNILPTGVQLTGGSGLSLTDFNGLPVGAENEKIKNVLSITPFR